MSFDNLPDPWGRYGTHGGRYVPETLMTALEELVSAYRAAREDAAFESQLSGYLSTYVGRPTPLYFAENLSRRLGGARIYLKREDLAHTGAHKINSALGQALLAVRMGKRRIIAETGAGQHGVATATACAMLGLECLVYMGEEDMRRQAINVYRMRLLGAEVRGVTSGSRTLKDAINEAIRDWVTNVRTTYYLLGSAVGPHPYPMMVRDFQSVIGEEARAQALEAEGRLPDYAVACVGGGSNSIGLFHPMIGDESVRLVGVEAGGEGTDSTRHAATLVAGRPGVLHGAMSYLLQDEHGQVRETHSISAGSGLPGRRAGAQLPEGHGPGGVRCGDGLAGAGGVPPAFDGGGDHTGAGACARGVLREPPGPDAARGRGGADVPERPRGQGRGHGDGAGGVDPLPR